MLKVLVSQIKTSKVELSNDCFALLSSVIYSIYSFGRRSYPKQLTSEVQGKCKDHCWRLVGQSGFEP